MTYKEYLEKRAALNEEAQGMMDAGNLEEASAKMEEVKNLDTEWDATAQALADLRALSDDQRVLNIQSVPGVNVEGGVVTAIMNFAPQAMEDEDADMIKSDIYKTAWAKSMMGLALTDREDEVFEMVNAAHTTANSAAVIPTSVANEIWDKVEESYPLWADVQKTYVNGNYTVPISTASSDAAWYDEATNTADATETFSTLSLVGCELARSITVSWKLREMAVEDFIPFIQRQLVKKIGKALGYGVSHGKGKPGVGDSFKPEPLGIITALLAETNTPQVATYTAGSLSYANLATARSKVSVGVGELAIYANPKTVWGELANVKDTTNRPIMIGDPTISGVTRIFGIPVKEDNSLSDGEVLFAAANVGYLANVNKEMSIETEEHVKARNTDYCAYAIVDGGVLSTKAFSLLKNS